MAKYTMTVKSIVENIYVLHNEKDIEELVSTPITIGDWTNDFNTEYVSPFDTSRDKLPDVDTMINYAIDYIFNFTFPVYDATTKLPSTDKSLEKRKELCTKILKQYYMEEIGFETIGRWQLALNNELNRIMPYFNQLYYSVDLNKDNPLENYDIQDDSTRNTTSDGNSTTNSNGTSNGTSRQVNQDTPTSKLGDTDYASFITDVEQNGSDTGTSTNTSDNKVNDVYSRHAHGITNYSKQDMLSAYRENIINIDEQIVYYLHDLFMLIY